MSLNDVFDCDKISASSVSDWFDELEWLKKCWTLLCEISVSFAMDAYFWGPFGLQEVLFLFACVTQI